MVLSYLDNCGNSRANTCLEAPTRFAPGKSAFIRSKPTGYGLRLSPDWRLTSVGLMTLDNLRRSYGLAPTTHLSNVCPINLRWYALCLPRCLRVTGDQGSIPEREHEKRLPHPRKAAGAQITHSWNEEVVTKNNNTGLFRGPVIGMSTL